jgi:transcriptional regulator with XRE-family HTH domain
MNRKKSRNSDTISTSSLKNDIRQALFGTLREARLKRNLSQEELATKLGLGQRQISDLERGAMDPRLSTVENVARALDLDLMLIPRHLIAAVESLHRATSGSSTSRPLYALSDDDSEPDPGDRLEVGTTDESQDPEALQRRRRKDPR